MKLKLRQIVEEVLPYLPVFVVSIYHPVDPDLGWHLKYGEYFIQHGTVLRVNTFSSEMAGYHWPNVSWGIDVLTYVFYQFHGFLGLSLASAAIVTLTFFCFAQAFRLDFWQKAFIFPILIYFLTPINKISFRGQLVSLMLVGLLTYLMKRYETNPGKVVYFVPLVFLFWVNLHGLFLLGLGIFMLWEGLLVVSEYLKHRKIATVVPHLKYFIPVTLLAWIATLLHPFGPAIYLEVIDHIHDPLLKFVAEYNTVEELSIQWYNFILISVLASIGLIAYGVSRKLRQQLPNIGLFSVIFILSLWVKRYSWAMYYLVLPFLIPMTDFLKPETKRGRFIGGTSILLVTFVFVLIIKMPLSQFRNMNWQTYCNLTNFCSVRGAETLRKYYKTGKTFTPYSFGGWLIWNYPDLKPAADGRMHLWKDEHGYSGFLYTYLVEWDKQSIDSAKYDIAFVQKDKPVYYQLLRLAKSQRWQQVYSDKTTAIFTRI